MLSRAATAHAALADSASATPTAAAPPAAADPLDPAAPRIVARGRRATAAPTGTASFTRSTRLRVSRRGARVRVRAAARSSRRIERRVGASQQLDAFSRRIGQRGEAEHLRDRFLQARLREQRHRRRRHDARDQADVEPRVRRLRAQRRRSLRRALRASHGSRRLCIRNDARATPRARAAPPPPDATDRSDSSPCAISVSARAMRVDMTA